MLERVVKTVEPTSGGEEGNPSRVPLYQRS